MSTMMIRTSPISLTTSSRLRKRYCFCSGSYVPESNRNFKSRFGLDQPRNGADILVESLERHGVETVFAYPGGESMEIHNALTRSGKIRSRHEQGCVFGAEGYARSSGKPGVCIATSGPGATNLVTGIANAFFDGIPLVAITGQVSQEIPIVKVTHSLTKKSYQVMKIDHLPHIMEEAFFEASMGRPGPVLIDVPVDIQEEFAIPKWEQFSYASRLPSPPEFSDLVQIARLVSESKNPVLLVGGGCLKSSDELARFVDLSGIPVASTFMGLGSYPCNQDLSLHMLGLHGTVYANYAMEHCDLLLVFGVQFDERVIGKIEAFATRAKIVHIDIDPKEIEKNTAPHFSVCGDIKVALQGLNKVLENQEDVFKLDFGVWRNELKKQKKQFPLSFITYGDTIAPQYAIRVLDELTNGKAIITTGVGQHQIWAAKFYNFRKPRQLISSGGIGAMGFGLPAAIGACIANPDAIVVDIDGDGCFMMNVQELATIRVENIPVKIMIINNQPLGMVMEWDARLRNSNRAHTYLGNPEKEKEIFPNMLQFAGACGIPAARVTKKEDLREAIQTMLDTPGPYLLDVVCPHEEQVLSMIASGGASTDVVTEEDGGLEQ